MIEGKSRQIYMYLFSVRACDRLEAVMLALALVQLCMTPVTPLPPVMIRRHAEREGMPTTSHISHWFSRAHLSTASNRPPGEKRGTVTWRLKMTSSPGMHYLLPSSAFSRPSGIRSYLELGVLKTPSKPGSQAVIII
jgi:hypothetical protein